MVNQGQAPRTGQESLGQILARLAQPGQATLTNEAAAALAGSPAQCEACHGLGWLSRALPGHPTWQREMVPCGCRTPMLAAERQERLRRWSELPPGLLRQTFIGLVRTEGSGDAIDGALTFARGELAEKWLLLVGPVGVGKTHLAAAILNWRLEHVDDPDLGIGKYANVPGMLADLRDGFRDDSTEERFRRYEDVGLLVLDDLGAHKGSDWAWEQIYRLLDSRLMEQRETVVTTNLAPEQLPPRIADRLLAVHTGLVRIVRIGGPSWRSGREW